MDPVHMCTHSRNDTRQCTSKATEENNQKEAEKLEVR
uniref:Uncharacterized protein n=1 Tax=Rhizophora mucronata TaxID=61149 RepID=A0A2P2KMA4_RHIMU